MEDEITKKMVKTFMTNIKDNFIRENYDIEMICGMRESFKMLCIKLGIDTKFLQ